MATEGGPSIITDGLVLYIDAANTKSYPGSGTVWSDLSGNDNNGTLVNGPTFDSGNNGSIVFDGADDYADFNGFQTPLTNRSIELITSINTSINSSGQATIFGNSDQPGNSIDDKGVSILYRFDRISVYIIGYDPNASPVAPRTTLNLINSPEVGKYYHIILTHDNSIVKGYVNGELITSSSCIGSRQPNNSLILGSYSPGYSTKYDGNIALVKVYGTVLTPQEILQNYNATKSRYGL